MTIEQVNTFYMQDRKKYEIKNNKEFLNWLEKSIKNGYNCFINKEELQSLIDNITIWYEIKYPERELEYYEGIKTIYFQNIKKISNVMNIEQLFLRLSHNQLNLMKSNYRSKIIIQKPIYENDKKVDWRNEIIIQINKKNEEYNIFQGALPYYSVRAEQKTGKVLLIDYESIKCTENINLEQLLIILNENEELDSTQLKTCIYNHECDIELRNKILQLVALKLLYSKNTTPERGYERAKRFINEFNKKLNLNLSLEEINEIINKDYKNNDVIGNDKKIKSLVKKIIKK